MQLNFDKGEHGLPHFYSCSVAKWILQFHSDLLSTLAAIWFTIITVLYLLPALMCYIPSEQPGTKLRLFHGCSDKKKKRIGEGSKIKK